MQSGFRCIRIIFTLVMLMCSAASSFAGDTPQAASAEPEYTVTVAPKDKSHPHFGKGSQLGFVIDGTQGRELVVVRGKTYRFNVNTSPMHDFYLTTGAIGWGTAALTDGVSGNFTFRGTVTFRPGAETPDTVFYGCRNHQFMGGEIHVVNPGDEGKIKISEPLSAASGVPASRPALDKNEVNQRLNFATMFITNSEAAKRVAASSDEEAKAKYQSAQDKLATGTTAFDSGNLPLAKSSIDEAMVLMTAAGKLVPSESAQKRARARNEELLVGVMSMEASYKQNREDLIRNGASKNTPQLDSDRIHNIVDGARALSDAGKFEDSNKVLTGVMSEISGSLNKLLANSTMSYDMKFSSLDEEYSYELDRFASLEKSIPQAVEQKQPPAETLTLMESYLSQAKAARDQASADAKQKNFGYALESIKHGTEQLETALKLLGVR
ncbi:MAG: hypothetical protein HY306_03520 [Nitrosomonadales bacterium]|nr:hypothetical protein [Nitrosomonadales bacterium]